MPFLYMVLLIASVFFYILYEHAFSFYLFAFLLLVPIILLILTIYTAKRTSVSFVDRQSNAGRSAKMPVRLRVVNKSPLPCPNLLIEIEYCNLLDGKNTVLKINTPVYPHEDQLMTLTVSTMHCGTVDFRIKRCKISDMLRLFSLRLGKNSTESIGSNCTITIMPEYVSLENPIDNYADMGLETDEYSKTQKGDDPSEIFDIRDYVDGDKLNRIHWKLSAKQDKTMVKDYSLPISNSITLLLELVRPKSDGDELARFDALIETAASVSNYLLENAVPHRVAFYDVVSGRLNELEINDDESHAEMISMLLSARLYDEQNMAVKYFIAADDRARCGHILYLSNVYSPLATELLSDAELANKYTYLLMTDDREEPVEMYDEFAELIPVCSSRLAESVQELCL